MVDFPPRGPEYWGPDVSPAPLSGRDRTVARRQAFVVFVLALVGGACAALSPVSPTGRRSTDVAVTFVVSWFVVWLAASAPWWALAAGSIVAAVGVELHPWIALALGALALSVGIGWLPEGFRWLRAIAAGAIVVALLHVRFDPILGGSAIVAGVVMAFLAIAGLVRRDEDVRGRALWCTAIVAILAVLSGLGLGLAASQASSLLRSGNDHLQDGLDHLRAGDTIAAASSLRAAAADLDDASTKLDAPWSRPAQVLPVVAQHRALITRVVASASTSAVAAADALDAVDIDQLRFISGSLDVAALGKLATPLAKLDTAVRQLADTLEADDSPWLIGPVRHALDDGRDTIDKALVQTQASEAVAKQGPAVLGADGTRRYLVVFTSPGAARGQSGTIVDYAEISVTDGKITQTAFGPVSDLVTALTAAAPLHLDASADYLARYGPFGAGSATAAVDPAYWANVTMSPDTPSAASAMAQMYAAGAGHSVDGVIVMDPVGLSSLVDAAGPISIPDTPTLTGSIGGLVIGHEVSAAALGQFLLVDQYTLADDVRVQLVQAAAGAGLQQFLGARLPGVQQLADSLGAAATDGDITWWSKNAAEEEAFRLVGMAGRLPSFTPAADDTPEGVQGSDGLAVVSDNAGGNLIDAYVHRTVDYDATYDASTGHVDGDVVITLRNAVPSSTLASSVIGNTAGLPVGTNRVRLSIYSPLTASDATVDTVSVDSVTTTELGWKITTIQVDVAPGATSTVSLHLVGDVAADGYSLVWRPQPMTSPDALRFAVNRVGQTSDDVDFTGTLGRTSRLDHDGVNAVR
ncbi:MAG: hypothetical protein JWM34_47 [Ilumatobacteraceae bacterium]|nr:hypothetical protein [Ilumatobacteraceae bacterium]